MDKYLTEFIGTFFLVVTIGLAVVGEAVGMVPAGFPPLVIGSMLMALVYAGGHISGAHYNPAVTLAFYIRGKCAAADIVPYWIAQLVAAVAAALVVSFLRDGIMPEKPPETNPHLLVLAAEFTFTFALVYVILNVATAAATAGNSYFGLAIGFTVLAGGYAVGNISGGVFNPAVAIGGAIMKLLSFQQIGVHIAAQLAAAVVAALVFMMTERPAEQAHHA